MRELLTDMPLPEFPGLLDQVSGLREIQLYRKPKRLFFAMDMAKAASCLWGFSRGEEREEGHLERSRADIRVVWSVDLRERGDPGSH